MRLDNDERYPISQFDPILHIVRLCRSIKKKYVVARIRGNRLRYRHISAIERDIIEFLHIYISSAIVFVPRNFQITTITITTTVEII